jgi:hypothetical protein
MSGESKSIVRDQPPEIPSEGGPLAEFKGRGAARAGMVPQGGRHTV